MIFPPCPIAEGGGGRGKHVNLTQTLAPPRPTWRTFQTCEASEALANRAQEFALESCPQLRVQLESMLMLGCNNQASEIKTQFWPLDTGGIPRKPSCNNRGPGP